MINDPITMIVLKREDLIKQAERERLAALAPHPPSPVRRELAHVIFRVASWLDEPPTEYVPPSESGPSDWLTGSASM